MGENGLKRMKNTLKKDKLIWDPPKFDRKSEIDTYPDTEKDLEFKFINHIRKNYLNKCLSIQEIKNIRFTSHQGNILYASEMPIPPIILSQEEILYINDMEYYELWHNWMLLISIIKNCFFDRFFICPVRDPRYSMNYNVEQIQVDSTTENYYSLENYSSYPNGKLCKENIKEFNCGIWIPPEHYQGSHCNWIEMLKQVLGSSVNKYL